VFWETHHRLIFILFYIFDKYKYVTSPDGSVDLRNTIAAEVSEHAPPPNGGLGCADDRVSLPIAPCATVSEAISAAEEAGRVLKLEFRVGNIRGCGPEDGGGAEFWARESAVMIIGTRQRPAAGASGSISSSSGASSSGVVRPTKVIAADDPLPAGFEAGSPTPPPQTVPQTSSDGADSDAALLAQSPSLFDDLANQMMDGQLWLAESERGGFGGGADPAGNPADTAGNATDAAGDAFADAAGDAFADDGVAAFQAALDAAFNQPDRDAAPQGVPWFNVLDEVHGNNPRNFHFAGSVADEEGAGAAQEVFGMGSPLFVPLEPLFVNMDNMDTTRDQNMDRGQ
jgi:hypothetical protein